MAHDDQSAPGRGACRVHWLSRLLLPVPGVEGLAVHVPELRHPAGQTALPLVWFLCLSLGVILCVLIDPHGTRAAFLLQLALVGGAFVLVDLLAIHGRHLWLRYFGRHGYRICFWFLITPGLLVGFLPGLVHIALVPGTSHLPPIPGALAGSLLLILGLALSLRVYRMFGLDRFLYLYAFHPEGGEVEHEEIYRYVRHPQYLSFACFIMGLVLLRGSIEAAALALPYLGFAVGRIGPEERELSHRFGPSYDEYRRATPGLVPQLHQLVPLLCYLFTAPIKVRRYDSSWQGDRYPG